MTPFSSSPATTLTHRCLAVGEMFAGVPWLLLHGGRGLRDVGGVLLFSYGEHHVTRVMTMRTLCSHVLTVPTCSPPCVSVVRSQTGADHAEVVSTSVDSTHTYRFYFSVYRQPHQPQHSAHGREKPARAELSPDCEAGSQARSPPGLNACERAVASEQRAGIAPLSKESATQGGASMGFMLALQGGDILGCVTYLHN